MKKIYYIFFLMLSLFFTTDALAADTFLYDPPSTDWLMKNIMTPLFTPETSPFGAVSGVFLGAVLTLGGILAAYTLILGTINTAHEGEVMGKRWSTLYMPIRTAFGIAMIMPIKSGFCTIQIIIIYLATQGIGFADQAWDKWSDNPLQGSVLISPNLDSALSPIYINAVKYGVCEQSIDNSINKAKTQGGNSYESLNYALSTNADLGNGALSMTESKITTTDSTAGIKYNFGFSSGGKGIGTIDAASLCGSIYFAGLKTDTSSNSTSDSEEVGVGVTRPQSASDLIDIGTVQSAIYAQQIVSLPELLKNGEALGKQLANENNIDITVVSNKMESAIKNYQSELSSIAKTSFSEALNTSMLDSMKADGFVSAGSWFYKVSLAQNAVNKQFSNIPVISGITNLAEVAEFDSSAISKMNGIGNVMEKAKTKLPSGLNSDDDDSSHLAEVVVNKLLTTSGLSDVDYGNITGNPIYIATNLGQNLIVSVGIALAALAGILGGLGVATGGFWSSWTGSAVAAGIAVTLVTPFMYALLSILVAPAVYLAIYLPLIPFIIWVGACVGWLVLVVEALFAGPLWAMAHIAPDADSVVGRQGQGYMLVLSLILRPILMVIGFVVALNLLTPTAEFVNYFFGFMVQGVAGSNIFSEFFIGIGSLIVYCLLLNNLVKQILTIIYALPDGLLQWIGGQSSRIFGEYAKGVEGDTSSGQAAALGAMTGAATNGFGGFGKKMEGKLKQNINNYNKK